MFIKFFFIRVFKFFSNFKLFYQENKNIFFLKIVLWNQDLYIRNKNIFSLFLLTIFDYSQKINNPKDLLKKKLVSISFLRL